MQHHALASCTKRYACSLVRSDNLCMIMMIYWYYIILWQLIVTAVNSYQHILDPTLMVCKAYIG